jgi:hypothetical protein
LKTLLRIWSLALVCVLMAERTFAQNNTRRFHYDFFGEPVAFEAASNLFVDYHSGLTENYIATFIKTLDKADHGVVINELLRIKETKKLDDWLYYQLIRKTAAQFSPKAENYFRYTLYKWFLLTRSGYDATIRISNEKMLFYVRSDENIYNIPAYTINGRQYVCLNYHDYGSFIDFEKEKFREVELPYTASDRSFSYKITHLPDFNISEYMDKDIHFSYYQDDYQFRIRLNPQIKTIFANYPVVDYESYFNIPLSEVTYRSLIPILKKNTNKLSVKRGVDYLMHFTRHAFLFKTDTENFGAEKRLSPEQTLLYDESDCEDRAALFFYLVKEIYDLPMIVLAYPEHVTVAVKFNERAAGTAIIHNGDKYYVCEPTPQKKDLRIGQLSPELKSTAYEIAYEYNPRKEK